MDRQLEQCHASTLIFWATLVSKWWQGLCQPHTQTKGHLKLEKEPTPPPLVCTKNYSTIMKLSTRNSINTTPNSGLKISSFKEHSLFSMYMYMKFTALQGLGLSVVLWLVPCNFYWISRKKMTFNLHEQIITGQTFMVIFLFFYCLHKSFTFILKRVIKFVFFCIQYQEIIRISIDERQKMQIRQSGHLDGAQRTNENSFLRI